MLTSGTTTFTTPRHHGTSGASLGNHKLPSLEAVASTLPPAGSTPVTSAYCSAVTALCHWYCTTLLYSCTVVSSTCTQPSRLTCNIVSQAKH